MRSNAVHCITLCQLFHCHSSPTTLLRLHLPRGACALRIRLSQLKGVRVTEVVQTVRCAERARRTTSTGSRSPAPTCKTLYSAEPISEPSADGAKECFACPREQRCLGEAHTLQCTPLLVRLAQALVWASGG